MRARVIEPFQGVGGFGKSLLVAGPTVPFYEEVLREQTKTSKAKPSLAARFGAPILSEIRKMIEKFPVERDFDDAGGDNPRNNSSAIISLMLDGEHMLLPGDAGVPAITAAMDYLDAQERTANRPKLLLLPHHGSRHNLDLQTIQRILGDRTDDEWGTAVSSVGKTSKNPSPRVANAAGRRGYPVLRTAGMNLRCKSPDVPKRKGWVDAVPLSPLDETYDH